MLKWGFMMVMVMTIVSAGSTLPAAMEETCTAFVLIPEMLIHTGRLQQAVGLCHLTQLDSSRLILTPGS